MTASDFLKFRGCLQPGLDAGMRAILKERAERMDIAVAAGRRASVPRAAAQLRGSTGPSGLGVSGGTTAPWLRRPHGLAAAAGAERRAWAFTRRRISSAPRRGCESPSPLQSLGPLVLRYLQAYGPATSETRRPGLASRISTRPLRPSATSSSPSRVQAASRCYDLPDAPRPDADTPAPIRFIPEWDSVIVTRADERVVAKADRPRVFLPGLRVAALVLVDGFAAAVESHRHSEEGAAHSRVLQDLAGSRAQGGRGRRPRAPALCRARRGVVRCEGYEGMTILLLLASS